MAVTKELINEFKETIISLHDECIRKSGGLQGVLSDACLEFAIYDIIKFSLKNKNNHLLTSAYVCLSIATKHCFYDGNKRTAHLFAKYILLLDNMYLSLYYKDACTFILMIAQGKKTLQETYSWLKAHTNKLKKNETKKYLREFYYDITYTKNENKTQKNY